MHILALSQFRMVTSEQPGKEEICFSSYACFSVTLVLLHLSSVQWYLSKALTKQFFELCL